MAYPVEGAPGPDTYLPNASLTSCSLLNPYPDAVFLPWNPTVDQAKAFCSQKVHCGGIVYTSAAANLAQGNPNLAAASYCLPQNFVAGIPSSTSGVAFVRYTYGSCDLRISLTSTVTTHHGVLTSSREACVKPGRGLTAARDRTPRPNRRKYEARPKPIIQLEGHHYEIGKEVFVDATAAQNKSVHGTSHVMISSSGVSYYMPGATHATRDQSEKPFARDGWFPLYSTEAGAKAASIRGGGNGQAFSVGPTSPLGSPSRWLKEPHVQVHWMPADGLDRFFYGDYVAPFSLDGYYPLYRQQIDAEKASLTGTAQSHGQASSTGHPLSWSTGETRLYYMPVAGPAHYYGNYYEESLAEAPLYSHTAALKASGPVGVGKGSLSAAQVIAHEATPTNTEAAAATLMAASSWATR